MFWIDRFLNAITMYKLVLYGLAVCAAYALMLSFTGRLPFTGMALFSSLALLVMTCYGSNLVFSKICKAPVNSESQIITALILFFILFPAVSISGYALTALVAVIAMASKYLVVFRRAHICNPVAIALVVLGLAGSGEAVWWVGNPLMFPLVAVLGFLVVRKLKRMSMAAAFLASAGIVAFGYGLWHGMSATEVVSFFVLSGPALFFATIMLTEPLTAPGTHRLQVGYGVVVGLLFSSPFSFGPLYSTPELALVIGNILFFTMHPKERFKLFLKEKKEVARAIFDFTFSVSQGTLSFKPGQYVECTLPHTHADNRGERRYFTIASSPTEREVHFGIRVDGERGSSFKKAMLALSPEDPFVISGITGGFVLPEDTTQKMVFLAGGIGVTPFRSMSVYLKDMGQQRDVVLFYASKTESELAYRDVFDHLDGTGIRVVYVVNEQTSDWKGRTGMITKEMIMEEVPDFASRLFYISGPHLMVLAFRKTLGEMGVPSSHISTDFFPGYA